MTTALQSNELISVESLDFQYPSGDFYLNIPEFKVLESGKIGVTGPSGSGKILIAFLPLALDLSMNTLYFGNQVPELIPMTASDEIMDTDLAISAPMYVRFKARGFPVVGTTFDYFEFRNLVVEKGEMLTLLGDCIVGATVANALGLSPGFLS